VNLNHGDGIASSAQELESEIQELKVMVQDLLQEKRKFE
jgi:hypothetical protein